MKQTKNIRDGGHELERTLKTMKDNCSMAWVVLSTTSLLDQQGAAVPQDKLESLVRRSGYKSVTLDHILRNSSTITSATAPDNVNRYSGANISKSISAGSCSTVTGTRPTCYLYKYSRDDVNYSLIGECVDKYLELHKTAQTVILCDRYISPRQVKPLLTGDVTLYDAGVEKFDVDNTPRHYRADLARQREDLVKWINSGGVLLTHDNMFRGCEAETIVFLTQYWGGGGGGQTRSGPTRAVSQLCLVTSDPRIRTPTINNYFTVIDMRRSGRQSVRGGGDGYDKMLIKFLRERDMIPADSLTGPKMAGPAGADP